MREENAVREEKWGRTSDVRVGCCLERAEAVANDKDTHTKTGKGVVDDGGNGEQRAEAVQKQAPDKDGAVAKVAENPGCVAERSERVRPVSS
jgi:hypothetical protein